MNARRCFCSNRSHLIEKRRVGWSTNTARNICTPPPPPPLLRNYNTSSSTNKPLREMKSKNKTSSLPDPLPPRSDGTKVQSLSPVEAKRRYIESQATKEFLMNPKESIVKLQHEMNQTKLKLHKEIDKPLWTRIVNRVKTRQHSVINLLMASLAYLLAHRLDLKMIETTALWQWTWPLMATRH